MKKLLIVLLTTMLSFTTLTANIAAEGEEVFQETIETPTEESKQEEVAIPETVVIEKTTEPEESTPIVEETKKEQETPEVETIVVEQQEQTTPEQTPEVTPEVLVEEQESKEIEEVPVVEEKKEETTTLEQPTENQETKQEENTSQETQIDEKVVDELIQKVEEKKEVETALKKTFGLTASSPLLASGPLQAKGNDPVVTLTTDGNGTLSSSDPLTVKKNTSYVVDAEGKISFTLSDNKTTVTVIPKPNEGYRFVNWTVAGSPVTTDKIAENMEFKATFAKPYVITYLGNGGEGTMDPTTYMPNDDSVQLKINAFEKTGHKFKNWSGSDGKTYTDKQTINKADFPGTITLTAQWDEVKPTYTITNETTDSNITSVKVDSSAEAGSKVSVEVAPKTDYIVDTITVKKAGGESVNCNEDSTNNYSFTMPESNVSVTVTAKEKPAGLDISKSATDCTITCNPTAIKGATVEFTVTPKDEEYEIESVKVINDNNQQEVTCSKNGEIYSFEMPNKSVTITATAKAKTYLISKNPGENVTSINVTGSKTEAAKGETITFTITTNNNCSLSEGYPTVTYDGGSATVTEDLGTYSFEMPNKGVTINAVAEVSAYTVTLDLDGGTTTYDFADNGWVEKSGTYTKSFAKNTVISTITGSISPVPTKENHNNAGWDINPDIETLNQDITIKSRFNEKAHFTFIAGDGKFSDGSSEKKVYLNNEYKIDALPETPTLEGKFFDKWYYFLSTMPSYKFTFDVLNTRGDDAYEEKVYAEWADGYTVHFDGNGANKGKMPDTKAYKTYTLPECLFTNKKREFSGWKYTIDETTYIKAAGETIEVNAPITLIAQWDKATVSFDANGGDGTMNPEQALGDYVIPDCRFTTNTKIFDYWTIIDDEGVESVQHYYPGTKINIVGSITLKAYYKNALRATYVDENGQNPIIEYVTSKEYVLAANTFQVPTGMMFVGWTVVGGDSTVYNAGSWFDFKTNTTFKAKFVDAYTVTFEVGTYGQGSMDPVGNQNGRYVLPECTFTSKNPAYFFAGWSDGKNTYYAGDAYNVTKDTTLTALWTNEVYTVRYYRDADKQYSTGMSPDTGVHGQYELRECEFTTIQVGKKFAGWSSEAFGELVYDPGDKIFVNASMADEEKNIDIIAVFKDAYTIVLNANGGTCDTTSVQRMKGERYSLPIATKADSIFKGWSYSSDGTTGVLGYEATFDKEENTTLYAQYEQVQSGKKTFQFFNLNQYDQQAKEFIDSMPIYTLYNQTPASGQNYVLDVSNIVTTGYDKEYYTVLKEQGGQKSLSGQYQPDEFGKLTVIGNLITAKDVYQYILISTVVHPYTITYINGNGLGNDTYTIEDMTFALPTPNKKEGFEFVGWFDETYTTQYTQIEKGSYGNKTFYGKWQPAQTDPEKPEINGNLDVVVVDEDSILSGEVAPTIEQTIQLIENLGVDGEAIEKAYTLEGKKVKLILTATEKDEQDVSELVKTIIGANNINSAYFFDLDLNIQIHDLDETRKHVSDAGYEMSITIKISKVKADELNLVGANKRYYVVRNHDNETKKWEIAAPTSDAEYYYFTFNNQLFSEFALYSEDVPQHKKHHAPKTGIDEDVNTTNKAKKHIILSSSLLAMAGYEILKQLRKEDDDDQE